MARTVPLALAQNPPACMGLDTQVAAAGAPMVVGLLAANTISSIADFLLPQAALHLRRVAQQWRDATDTTIDEQARAPAFLWADSGDGVAEWSEVRWIAAARHVPRILQEHCEGVYESLQQSGHSKPQPGSLVMLTGLKKVPKLNTQFAVVKRWDPKTSRWVVIFKGQEVYAMPENLKLGVQLPPEVRRRTTLAFAQRLAVELALRPCNLGDSAVAMAAGMASVCGTWGHLAEPLLQALPLTLRYHAADEQDSNKMRMALGSPAMDDYLLALAFLEDGVQEAGTHGQHAAAVLRRVGGAANGAADLLAVLCASPHMAVVRRALHKRVVEAPSEAAERAEMLRSSIDVAGLQALIRERGFSAEHFFTSSGAVANICSHTDVSELVRLAVRVRRARAIFDHLDVDADGRLQAGELLQFVEMAVPGLLEHQAAKRGIPLAVHRQQYAERMMQLCTASGFVDDLVQGAYAEDREPVYALVVVPPFAAASAAALQRALANILTAPGERDGRPRPVAADAVACCAELAWAVDLSASLCLYVGGREVLGPPVAIAVRFHGATFTGSAEGLQTLLALASPAALAKCASTDYSSERWCNDVPFLVTHLLESAGLELGSRYAGIAYRRRVTHAVEAEE